MTSLGFNWYDVVVLLALVYGLWSGIRTGLSGEIIRVLGLVLTVWLAVLFYAPVGAWLAERTNLAVELANLLAFVAIATLLFAVVTMFRGFVHKQMQSLKFGAMFENLGGAAAGVVRMAVIMAILTVGLTLVRSSFWHEQVARNSQFGAIVVKQFPSIAAAAQKQFPEKTILFRDLKRAEEPSLDEGGTNAATKLR